MPQQMKKTRVKKPSRLVARVSRTVKAKRSVSRKQKRQSRLQAIRARFGGWKWTESYNSFLLGIVVVIVAVLFVASFLHSKTQLQQTSSITTAAPIPTATIAPVPGKTYTENGKTYYVVKPNDSLWLIAGTVYGNGYKWVDIASANNLTNPSTIFSGDKLFLPNAPQPSTLGEIEKATITPPSSPVVEGTITTTTYTVEKGDTLWDIAERAYANGYKWTDIAKVNNLANPGLIFSGNVLTLPR